MTNKAKMWVKTKFNDTPRLRPINRTTNHKREWNTKTNRAEQRRARVEAEVQNWWNDCQQRERLLAPGYQENVDYIGDGPWPMYVAFNALYEDFMANAPVELGISKPHFAMLARRVMQLTREDTYTKSIRQGKYHYKTVTFVSLRMWHERNRLTPLGSGKTIQG